MQKNKIDILLIEDCEDDAILINRHLRRSQMFVAAVDLATSAADAHRFLDRKPYDVVLTDLNLPDSQNAQTIAVVKEGGNSKPVIALTGHDENSIGIAAIQAGAADYLNKDELNESLLSRTIMHSIERHLMEQKLVEANQKLESKNKRLSKMYDMAQQFVDNVSHELRTPLTVIREFASIVRDGLDGPVTSRQKIRLSTLLHRTDDLANMVDDLLDTSRLESGLLRTCRRKHQLRPILEKAASTLQSRLQAKRIKFSIAQGQDNLSVYCDAEKLGRILINLLSNSIKFTPVGETISISYHQDSDDKVRVTVKDTGPGIPAAKLEKIFGRFQQIDAHQRFASSRGFGLGLSIASALASLNLGSLEVASVEGVGSEFSVLVPKANWASILNCYIDQREANAAENRSVSFFRVSTNVPENQCDADTIESIDEFMRSTINSFDLVLCSGRCEWLVFASTSGPGLRSMQQRLLSTWEELREERFGASLPALSFDHDTTFAVGTNRDFLINLVSWEMNNSTNRPQKTMLPMPKLNHTLTNELQITGVIK